MDASLADPTHVCQNNKPCGCSMGGAKLETPICLNYMQCGSTLSPGICGDASIHVNFSIELDGLKPNGMHVSEAKYKCCVDIHKGSSEMLLAAQKLNLPVDMPEAPRESKDSNQMIMFQGTGTGMFLAGVGVGTAFVAPWCVLAFIAFTRCRGRASPLIGSSNSLLG